MLPSHRVNRADLFGIRALNAGIDGGVVQAKAIPRQASLMRQQRMLQGRRLDRPEKSHTHVDTFSERIPDKRWLDGNAVGFDPNHFTDLRDIGIFRDSNIAREAHVTQSSGIVRDSGTVTLQHPIPLVPKAPLLSLPSPDVPSELTPSIPSSSLSSTPVSSTSSSSPRLLSKVYSLPPPPRLPMAKVRRQRSRSWPAPLRFTRQSNPAPIDLWCEPGHESDTISAVESLWQGSGSSQESLTSVSALSEPYQFAPYRLAMSTATADAVRRTKDPVDVRSSRFGKNQHVSEVYAPYQSGFSGLRLADTVILRSC